MTGIRNKFIKLKRAKKFKPSSKEWLSRHLNDQYVIKSKVDGYRSRAAYKLIEINEKFSLIKQGTTIVDLGSSPGGWSQFAALVTKSSNDDVKIIAIDLLDMPEIDGVTFIQDNFHSSNAKGKIKELLHDKVDLVMSDMAANTTGHFATDHIRTMDLCEQALIFALEILRPGGNFIAKIFQGGTENTLLNLIKANFHTVKHFKPRASRKQSTENYLIALAKK